MQTAYTIHMGEGPSIRRIISTEVQAGTVDTTVKLNIRSQDCDEYFKPKGEPTVFTSDSVRRSWKRRLRDWSTPIEQEAAFHFNMRRQLFNQYNWRFELNGSLSDPLR